MAYSEDTVWRNRDSFFRGREAVKEFLAQKWAQEKDYKLRKHLWAYSGKRISVRFEYEFRDGEKWFRAHGIELWEFDRKGYMRWRDMSAADVEIEESTKRL
eukprot:CAMPEP_0171458228 /NCGR_PEP_ID=MMETSP0945-20130129/3993_1 /TAXON_ID=109269 /ORGANISM="Vaucheria litorea, Strain CCMP2940" /LENGTH=100 /DNA_ID=CAMNT_0011983999 /DNA_START=255 /DNA_END=557 /DNA_ORIENTATION=+